MAYSRKRHSKRKNIRLNKRRTNYRKNKNIKGGSCPCNSIFKGGSSGPSNLTDVPIRYFYGMNNYENDPNNAQVDTRMQGAVSTNHSFTNPSMKGGKRKSRKNKNKKRLIKGGDANMLNSMMSNFATTVGVNTYAQNMFGTSPAVIGNDPPGLLDTKPFNGNSNPYIN
jgi:hypothetical protein